MLNLEALEHAKGDYTQSSADICEDRVAGILGGQCPYRWCFELVECLNVEDDEARAMVRQSHAEGLPPVRLQIIAACQIEAALLRGHLTATEA